VYIEAKIKETQTFLQNYMKSALELGEIFKQMAEEKFGQKFEVQLGGYDEGVECIRINMIPEKKLTWKQRDKWLDKVFDFEWEINKKYSLFEGIYVEFGMR